MAAQSGTGEPGSVTDRTYQFDLEDLDDAEDAGRQVKCQCEELIELNHDRIVTVEVSVEKVGIRNRFVQPGSDRSTEGADDS